MPQKHFITLLTMLALGISSVLASPAAAESDTDLEQVFSDLRTAYYGAETPAEKLVIVKAFLAKYPDSKYTAGVLGAGTYLLSEELDDHEGAVAYARDILVQVEDPETKGNVRLVLVGLFDRPEYAADLTALAAEMAAASQTSFSDHLRVLESAVAAEAWDLTLQQVEAAGPLANAATFQADHTDQEFAADYIEQAGRHRQGLLGTYRGWALANQGETDAALRSFSESEGMVKFTYLGVPENDLYLYWGQTRLANNENEAALEMLSLAAIWGYSDDAMEAARKVYAELKGGEAGYTDYLWEVRRNTAQTLADFTLNDYKDAPRSFAELKGKVTLLAFWFPT